ncbi:MAG: flagellar assembly protein FliX [Pseudomonadota bacterium]
MKVETSHPLRTPKRTGATKSHGSSGQFAQSLDDASSAGAPATLSGTGAIGGMDALLSLQSVEEPGQRTKRAQARAHTILDELERMRLDLLMGEVPVSRLQQIAGLVARTRDRVADDRLASVLDDVDLRARVELAKLGFDMSEMPS